MICREICEKYRSDLFIVNQFSDVFSNTFQNLLRIFSIVVIFPSHQMAFQILLAVNLLTIMDTFLERMDTVRPKKAMYFGDVSLITSSNVGLEPKRSMMNRSITAEYIIMILQMQMYLTFSEIQWLFSVFLAKFRQNLESTNPFFCYLQLYWCKRSVDKKPIPIC